MSYIVLARKLRPNQFGDLVGQEITAQILRNAVLADRVAHAFLFSGSRGVGKTSAARILARAINCIDQNNGDPCNNCENCVDINKNASPDIFEIDAASNRGIENIRELRENINYVPARCRYKVYIIDEAHMLTLESFNALLKTLEEPPPFVKFIFATTDPHKIPQTIISRCQRYDFLRIPIKKMTDYLEKIVKDESLEISRNALETISNNSAGGMRDALTAIDQILSFEGTKVSDQKVAQILGILDNQSRFSLTEALLKKKDDVALKHFNNLQERGHDANDILSDLLKTIKNISLLQTLGTKADFFQDISEDDLLSYESLSKVLRNNELQQIFQILLKLEERLKISSHTKICFEMAILQITSIHSLVGLKEMIDQIKSLRCKESQQVDENQNNYKKGSIELVEDKFEEKSDVSNKEKLGDKKNIADASTIKNILKSEKNELNGISSDSPERINEMLETKVKISNDQESNQHDGLLEKNEFVKESSIKTNENELDKIGSREIIKESQYFINEKQDSDKQELTSLNQSIKQSELEVIEGPPKEWFEFSNEVQKHSPKLASFVRNAIPQKLSESKLKLVFKNGSYISMINEANKNSLEKIASDFCGRPISLSCEDSKSFSTKKTISEYELIISDKKKELKRKNARESPQVKGILSAFKNSKITNLELSGEKEDPENPL